MDIFLGKQVLPNGVHSYHIWPALLFTDARGDPKFAGGYNYSMSLAWLTHGITVAFGK